MNSNETELTLWVRDFVAIAQVAITILGMIVLVSQNDHLMDRVFPKKNPAVN